MFDANKGTDCISLPLTSVKLAYIITREHNVSKSNKSNAIKSSTKFIPTCCLLLANYLNSLVFSTVFVKESLFLFFHILSPHWNTAVPFWTLPGVNADLTN